MLTLLKIGGSCLGEANDALSANLAIRGDGKTIIVHGYSRTLRSLLEHAGVSRYRFMSASGTPSHLTGEAELYASLLAAKLDNERLSSAVQLCGLRAHGVLGHDRLLIGARKQRVRFYEGTVLKTVTDDHSGRFIGVDREALDHILASCDVLVVGALLLDPQDGPVVADADAVAAGLAVALGLSRYVVFSDVPGFAVSGTVVGEIPRSRIGYYATHATGGMVKKLRYIEQALANRVDEVYLCSTKTLPDSYGTRFYAD